MKAQQITLSPAAKRVVNAVAVATGAVIATSPAFAAGDFDTAGLALTGLAAAAGAVGTLKAGPALAMWGWNKIVGMIGK